MGDGSDCVINGSSASAGDFWHSLEVVGESSAVNEVGHRRNLSLELFSYERRKSAKATDIFIFYTTAKDCDEIKLPPRSAIVDGDSWKEYFGPFAGKTYRLRSHAARKELQGYADQELESPNKRPATGESPDSKRRKTMGGPCKI